MPELEYADGTIFYAVESAGPAVLLLHPVGLDGGWWEPFAARLGRAFRVVRMDLRGHGRSSPVTRGYRLDELAADAAAVLVESGSAPAHVVGLSFGGMVAQHLALAHPGLVRSLVLCGTAATLAAAARPVVAERGAAAVRSGMAGVLDDTLGRWFSPGFLASDTVARCRARLLAQDVDSWAAAWRAISELDTVPRLGRIRVPTLVLTGDADVAAPPEAARLIAENIPGAHVRILPGAPHMAPFEQPEPFASLVEGFLAGPGRFSRPAANAGNP